MHRDGWVSGQGIGPKNHTIKSNNIHKDFELYQVFMHNFFYTKMSRYSHYTYYLQKELRLCDLRVSENFVWEVLEQFGIENHK